MDTASPDRLTPKEVITRIPFLVRPVQNGEPERREVLFKSYGRLAMAIASTEGTRYYVAPPDPAPQEAAVDNAYQQELRRVQLLVRQSARNCLSMISAALKPAALGSTRSLPEALLNEITMVATTRIHPEAADERERFCSLLMESLDYVKKVRADARLKEQLPTYLDFRTSGGWAQEQYVTPSMFPLCNHGILQRMAENISATYWGAQRPKTLVRLGHAEHLASFRNVLKEVITQIYITKKNPAPTAELLEAMLAKARNEGSFIAEVDYELADSPMSPAYLRLQRSNVWYRVQLNDAVPKLVKEERLATPARTPTRIPPTRIDAPPLIVPLRGEVEVSARAALVSESAEALSSSSVVLDII